MIILLFIFWFIMSGKLSLYFIIAAVLSVIVTVYIDKKLFKNSTVYIGFNRQLISFLLNLFKEMYYSTKLMLKIIWFASYEVQPITLTIIANSKDKIKQTIQANCITLTPGTMTLQIKDNQILVHAISREASENIFGDKR